MASIEAGSVLVCTNEDCSCRLIVDTPCPHGEGYTCACGKPLQQEPL